MSLEQDLLTFIRTELATGDAGSVDENTQLIETGIIDSMALMRLISFVEERTGMRIPDEEVLPENFASVDSIRQLIDRLAARR